MVSIALIVPLMLPALALRGGSLMHTWAYLTAGIAVWLIYDIWYALRATNPLPVNTARGIEEGIRVVAIMFACIASNKSAEPNTLVVRIDFDRRDEMIAADPDVYYLKDHYVNYPVVLVRLNRVHPDALRELLLIGWRNVLKTAKPRARKRMRP